MDPEQRCGSSGILRPALGIGCSWVSSGHSRGNGFASLSARCGGFRGGAAADVFPGPFEQVTAEQWSKSIAGKGLGQINLVRAALPYIADKGSFTLISGVLTDENVHGGTIGTTINHMVEGFAKAAAVELPRGVRINCISPTVLAESVAYHSDKGATQPVY